MLKKPGPDRSASVASAFEGLMPLESRRMMDGASMGVPETDGDAITRLDGVAAEWSDAEDGDYGMDPDESGDQPGSDADLYSFFTLPATGMVVAEVAGGDEPGDDRDMYDFGQDRGEAIDDEAEYDGSRAIDVHTPLMGPSIEAGPADELVDDDSTVVDGPDVESSIAPVALVPPAGGISWLGSVPAISIGEAAAEKPASPASWSDLTALAEPAIAVQA